MTVGTLKASGDQALFAEIGVVALAQYIARQKQISLVFTDCMMSVVNGSTLFHPLSKIKSSVKIIATSGVPAKRALADLSGHGMIDFITKPHTPQTLLSSLQQAFHEATCQA